VIDLERSGGIFPFGELCPRAVSENAASVFKYDRLTVLEHRYRS